jgi:DNA polymerase II
MPQAEKIGFLLQTYVRPRQKQVAVYGIGKLDNGETFGFVDRRIKPRFYIYSEDLSRANMHLTSSDISIKDSQRVTMQGEPVIQVETEGTHVLKQAVTTLAENGISTFEGDIPLAKRYLIEHDCHGPVRINGDWQPGQEVDWTVINPELTPCDWEPELAILSIDIETNREATLVTAISSMGIGPFSRNTVEEVGVVGEVQPEDPLQMSVFATEKELLQYFSQLVQKVDPDIITGWNVIDFDLKVLRDRFKANHIPFTIGRSRDSCYYLEGSSWGGSRVIIYGRQVVDTMHLVRNTLSQYDDYRLETVAQAVLGRGKLLTAKAGTDMVSKIERAYQEDRPLFAEYCLEDARLVQDILAKEDLIRLSLRRCILTGLPLENAWGSVAAFEFLYLSELYKKNIVASPVGKKSELRENVPGGYVFAPKVGLHSRILVFDFKSLYPSIIRTFNIDPLALMSANALSDENVITALNGARFDKSRGILPGLLDIFFERRAEAKKEGNDLASYTYKIVMNSFYGVLGTSTCRFASGQLAGAITHTGHYLLKWCRDLFQESGWTVLYGDTDSLFLDAHLPEEMSPEAAIKKGHEICEMVNQKLSEHLKTEFGLESQLELEFEKLYKKLLLPPARGSESRGRAKGYAGMILKADGEELQIVGMEAVRRDWTKLSHIFQRDLLTLLFKDAPASEMEQFIKDELETIRTGQKDDQLIYRKALRKPVEEYTKTTPPHVKAARLLPNPSGVIQYVMTIQGPQPVGFQTDAMDYTHYVEKQIKPIVEAIAQFCDINMRGLFAGDQLSF